MVQKESTGIKEEECLEIRKTLELLVNLATSLPDGICKCSKKIWEEIEDFKRMYQEWNDIDGTDKSAIEQRIAKLKKMRKKRHRIACKMRRRMHILEKELDLVFIEKCYALMGKLVEDLPHIFDRTSRAIIRFNKRKTPNSPD